MPDPMPAEASAEAGAGERSAAPRPKTATVERREASVPRYGTQGASQAPGVPRYVHAQRVFRRAPERLSALRPPSLGESEAKSQTPDADMRRGNEMGCLTS